MSRNVLRAAIGASVLLLSGGTFAAERVKVMENDRFILTRTTYPPGERQDKLHPPSGTGQMVTLITPAEIEVHFQEGDKTWTEKGKMEPGKVWYLPPTLLHQFANIGKQPYTYMVTTFK
jgi:mannose-6-phosphate isomerase-like protein (cupin superfamily)